MPNRPCKPDADMKRMWQTLLPGVAMPSCGTGETNNDASHEPAIAPNRKGGEPAPQPRP